VFDRISISFDRAIDPLSFTASDVVVTGPGGALRVSAIIAVGGSGGRSFTLMLNAAQTRVGTYRAVIGPDIRDANGHRMDQNGNGIGGQDSDTFTLTGTLGATPSPPPVSPPPPPPPPPPVSPPPVAPPPDTTSAGPRIVTAIFGGPRPGVFDRITVTFDRAINVSTLTPSDVVVTGPGGTIRVSAIIPVANSGNRQFYLVFSRDQSAAGTYRATIGPDIRDTAGNLMDQNGNGLGGQPNDSYSFTGVLGTAKAAELPKVTYTGTTRGFDDTEWGVWLGQPIRVR
jgi:hypothetical protein